MTSDTLRPAPLITDLSAWNMLKNSLGKVVVVSGGYDPIHPGHMSNILGAKGLGDTLVVVVNGDSFLERKKGKSFQSLEVRAQIVSYVIGVDFVFPFESEQDTVDEALRLLRPHVFAKGGDRTDESNIPEWQTCRACGIELETGVGMEKKWSSSDFLSRWSAT